MAWGGGSIRGLLKLLAPYVAVGVFWCGLSNAWLAILAYHAQIAFWLWFHRGPRRSWRPVSKRSLLLASSTAATGPLLYFLLPHVTGTELSVWLTEHHLSRLLLLPMIPYFGFVHPVLEQLHWQPLREKTPWAHPVFAGYHMLVLGSLLVPLWLIICFAVLTAASFVWHEMSRRDAGLVLPCISHVLADLGVVLVAWIST